MFVHLGGGAHAHNPLVRVLGGASRFGWAGVTLFFVLSGFLITGILWDARGSAHWWRNFFMRRSLRIFPLYYATLLLLFLGSYLAGQGISSLQSLWVYAVDLQNVLKTQAHRGPLLPDEHLWSLAVEEQFYLIWPWLLVRMRTLRQGQILCLAVFTASCAVQFAVVYGLLGQVADTLPANMGALALGGFLALTVRAGSLPKLVRLAPWVGAAGFAGFVFTVRIGESPRYSVGLIGLWLIFAAVLVQCLGDNWLSRLMANGTLRWIGLISYGLYIFHVLLIPVDEWLADRLIPAANRDLRLGFIFVVGTSLAFAAASASFYGFERPFLRWKRSFPASVPIS
jgi:peptidoglycan/LPS O-acetylase OafA/YrhL